MTACSGDREDEIALRFAVMKAVASGEFHMAIFTTPLTPLAPASVLGWVSLWMVVRYVSGLGVNGMTKKVMMSVDQHCWETRQSLCPVVMLDKQNRKGSMPDWISCSLLAGPRVRTGGDRHIFSFPVMPWMALVRESVIWVI